MRLLVLLLALLPLNLNVTPSDESLPRLAPDKGAIMLSFDGFKPATTQLDRDSFATSRFNDTEKLIIKLTVQNYYKYWDVIVTTDEALFQTYPTDHRFRAIITSDEIVIDPSNAGYSNTIGREEGDTTPVQVCSSAVYMSIKFTSAVIAHEIGHALGLDHHSIVWFNWLIVEEYDIHGGIMGWVYTTDSLQWKTGFNRYHKLQNDTALISRTFKRK